MTDLPASFQKLLAVFILALVLLPLVFLAHSSWSQFNDNTEAIQEKLDTYDRLRAISHLKLTAFNGQNAEDDPQLLNRAHWLLDGETPAVVLADLASRLRQLASDNQIEITQLSETPVVSKDSLSLLGIRIELFGPAQNIHQYVSALDNFAPNLFIENFNLRSDQGSVNSATVEPPLYADLEVAGAISMPASEAQVLKAGTSQ